MSKNKPYAIGMFLLLVSLVFTGCDTLFSTSWGISRSYDPSNINLTERNIDNWLALAVGNPALAKAILIRIQQDLEDNNYSNKAKWQTAGVSLAIESSGIGTSMLNNLDKLTGLLDDTDSDDATDSILELFKSMQIDFNKSGGAAAAGALAGIVNAGSGLDPGYAAVAQPADVALAIVVLALAVTEDDIEDIDDIGIRIDGSRVYFTDDEEKNSETIALKNYLELIADPGYSGNSITDAILDALRD